jgi:hypothetical protein
MKQLVWKHGLMSGVVLAVLTTLMMWLCLSRRLDFRYSEVAGYTAMVLSFLFVFFGIRSYRDEVAGGAIAFGRAFKVGLLITLVTCAFYVLAWEVVYWGFYPEFLDDYSVFQLERMRAGGATAAEIAAMRAQMARFAELYKNPLINVAITFLEVFPIGLIVTLVSAGILKRREPPAAEAAAGAAAAAR